MNYNKPLFLTALLIGTILLFSQGVLADKNEMTGYVSKSGAFQMKIPGNFATKTRKLRITSDSVLMAENVSATFDQRPYKNNIKQYIVQLEQTLGADLDKDDVIRVIDTSLNKYVAHYKSKGAALKNREKKYYNNTLGGEIYMTYNDEEMGTKALRIRVLCSDRSKITQIVTSANNGAFSLRSQEFFDSFSLKKGSLKNEGSIIEDWEEHTSPMKMYSVLLPPEAEPYVTEGPTFESNGKIDSIKHTIYDPVRNEKIHYALRGYKTGQIVTLKSAQHLVLKQHVAKYVNTPKGIAFERSRTREGFPILDTAFMVATPESELKGKVIKLRATFAKDYIMVQELVTSRALMQSRFVTNLLGHALFHPQDADKMFVDTEEAPTEQEETTTTNSDIAPPPVAATADEIITPE